MSENGNVKTAETNHLNEFLYVRVSKNDEYYKKNKVAAMIEQ